MHRRARDLHARSKCRFVDLQTVHPLAAERGDQGGVHVQDARRPARGEVRAQDGQETGQHDQIDLALRQQCRQCRLKGGLTAALLRRDRLRADAGIGRPRQRVSALVGRDHQRDLTVGKRARRLCVEQRLQICAAAGDQHGDLCFVHSQVFSFAGMLFQHRQIFSSPVTISPQT